jgi:selenophosphate synthetase-related protein
VRDLSVWQAGDVVHVVACDANASVGELPADFQKRPPEEAGYNATKVPLMEVIAAGARPLLVVNTLCGPLDDYGSRVVAGVRSALAEIGSDAGVTGSDETNMTTTQTGVGVTIIGTVPAGGFRVGSSVAGDVVVCVGTPKDGVVVPYREGDADIAAPRHVLDALGAGVHEVLPVGSKGVAYELGQLAATAGLAAEPVPTPGLDTSVSAGASTCFLTSLPPEALPALRAAVPLPVVVVATLRPVT